MRRPDPFVLRYRAHINIAALAVGATGFLVMFDSRYRTVGATVVFLAFMAWAYLQGRIRPRVADYLEHLRVAAEKEGQDGWLNRVEAEFMQTWGVESLEELNHE